MRNEVSAVGGMTRAMERMADGMQAMRRRLPWVVMVMFSVAILFSFVLGCNGEEGFEEGNGFENGEEVIDEGEETFEEGTEEGEEMLQEGEEQGEEVLDGEDQNIGG